MRKKILQRQSHQNNKTTITAKQQTIRKYTNRYHHQATITYKSNNTQTTK